PPDSRRSNGGRPARADTVGNPQGHARPVRPDGNLSYSGYMETYRSSPADMLIQGILGLFGEGASKMQLVFRFLVGALVAAATLTWSSASQAERRVALIIGNGAYKNVPRLPNPPKDA